MKTFLLAILCGFFLSAFQTAAVGAVAADRPNILFVLTDDQGWWDVGMRGNKDIDTPVMDRLSREGIDFVRYYAAPVCAPTRAGLMTGRYYFRTGLYNTRFGGDTLGLGEGPAMLKAEVVKAQGNELMRLNRIFLQRVEEGKSQ